MTDDRALETRDDGGRVVRFERHLGHPVERVWAALTEPDQLLSWWSDADVDLAGGSFTIRWLNTDDDGNSAAMRARVTELDPPNLLEIAGELDRRRADLVNIAGPWAAIHERYAATL